MSVELIRKINEHKALTFIAGALVIIPVVVILIAGNRSSGTPAKESSDYVTEVNKTITVPPAATSFPTLDASAVQALRIVSISPENNEMNVGLYPDIIVKFASQVTQEQQKQTAFMLIPGVQGQVRWLDNGWTVAFTPSKTLSSNQKYQAKLTSQNVNLTWSFQTTPAENVSIEDQRRSQAESDANYKQWEEDVYTKYPWLDKLPLQTEKYYAYYDLEKNAFVGLLYPDKSEMQPVDAQAAASKEEITTALKTLGIDPSKYTFEWVISPR